MVLLIDVLVKLARFQQRLQSDDTLILDVRSRGLNFVKQLKEMQGTPIPGGEVENFHKSVTFVPNKPQEETSGSSDTSESNGTYFYEDIDLLDKHRRSLKHNTNVSEVRSFGAVKIEVIASLGEFFTQRIPEEEFKELEALRHILPTTTNDKLRACHGLIVPDLPLCDFVASYREVSDSFSLKELTEMNPRDMFNLIRARKVECWQSLATALARLLAAKPHSADVERLISSYNQLKTPDRSSLTPPALSAMLFVRHNMPPVAMWDPRPATFEWMTSKDRRPNQNPIKATQQDYFKGIFF